MNDIEAVKREAALAIQETDVIAVTNTEEEKRAALVIARAKDMLKKVEAKRKDFVQPLNDHVKKINADFKTITEPIEAAISKLSSAILAYRQTAEWKEAQEYREAVRAEAKDAVERGDVAALQSLSDANTAIEAAAPKTVKTEAGSVGTRKVWKYEIEDPTRVPTEFWIIDEKRIGAAVRAGVRKINGVKIWEEETIVTRS